MSNTYLLADTAFLMAGHKYVSHLSQPKLKFAGGGQYTMSVTKGHKIIRILPTPADQTTPHRTIYFHLDEPYDLPTFVNNIFYQCSNRPNANTPSAFTWHLRYVWLQMPSSSAAHTVPRQRTPYPTRHVEQPIKATPLLSVFSWQDEKNKQTASKELHGDAKLDQRTVKLDTVHSRQIFESKSHYYIGRLGDC